MRRLGDAKIAPLKLRAVFLPLDWDKGTPEAKRTVAEKESIVRVW